MYCIRLQRPEEEFWNSRYGKILTILDMNRDEEQMKAAVMRKQPYTSRYFSPPVEEIHSMKEIEGFV